MKKWLNKSYLRISIAQYFHDEKLYADLPSSTFERGLWQQQGRQGGLEGRCIEQRPCRVQIRDTRIEMQDGQKYEGAQMFDHAVVLHSNKGNARLVTFAHRKEGDGYKSKVPGEVELSGREAKWQIRIASSDKLQSYDTPSKAGIRLRTLPRPPTHPPCRSRKTISSPSSSMWTKAAISKSWKLRKVLNQLEMSC
ncbi:MAG: hypothetical protein U0176_11310 [Bacteroidia bacterium]